MNNLHNSLMLKRFKSKVSGIEWPAILAPDGAQMMALQFQLGLSEWLPPEEIFSMQKKQLEGLLLHAKRTAPYYRAVFNRENIQFGKESFEETWRKIPLLTRSDLQVNGQKLLSTKPPESHGKAIKVQSSGSTGVPITAYSSTLTKYFGQSFILRDHFWHKRDISKKFFAIRPKISDDEPGKIIKQTGWGSGTELAFETGPTVALDIRTDVATQVQILKEHNPVYLLSFPSNIAALAKRFLAEGSTLGNLKEVRTYGEICTEEVRMVCREAWGVPVKDLYSTQEVGYIALQCPENEHYHVQSESVFVEVLDENNLPVAPGGIGKIVVTPLHNFIMPLIRYVLGDYGEVGSTCSCGRGLPVLSKILGRKRNMVVLPDGRQFWPSFPSEVWNNIAPIRQLQFVQKQKETLLVRIVADRQLSEREEKVFVEKMQVRFQYPFLFTFEYLEKIERSAGGKYEDFMSEI